MGNIPNLSGNPATTANELAAMVSDTRQTITNAFSENPIATAATATGTAVGLLGLAGITLGRRREEDEEDIEGEEDTDETLESPDTLDSERLDTTNEMTSEPESEPSDGLEGSEEYTNFRGDESLNPADSASGGTTGGTGDADDRKEDEEDGVSGNYSSSRGDAFGEGNEVSERSDQTLDADLLARNEEFAFNQNLSLLKKYYYATTEKKVLELSQRLQEMYPNKVEKIQVTLNEAKKIWDTPNPLVLSPEELNNWKTHQKI